MPLRGILILEKSPDPSFSPARPDEALKSLLGQAYRVPELFGDKDLFGRFVELCNRVPAFRFRFPKSPAAKNLLDRLFHEALG